MKIVEVCVIACVVVGAAEAAPIDPAILRTSNELEVRRRARLAADAAERAVADAVAGLARQRARWAERARGIAPLELVQAAVRARAAEVIRLGERLRAEPVRLAAERERFLVRLRERHAADLNDVKAAQERRARLTDRQSRARRARWKADEQRHLRRQRALARRTAAARRAVARMQVRHAAARRRDARSTARAEARARSAVARFEAQGLAKLAVLLAKIDRRLVALRGAGATSAGARVDADHPVAATQ